jgi:hypothetical protein
VGRPGFHRFAMSRAVVPKPQLAHLAARDARDAAQAG